MLAIAIAKAIWIDVVVLLTIAGLLFAGMRGFPGYFPFVMGIASLYLVFFYVRAFRRKKRS
jgi:hypothetical protein